jgi:hypothetical protein
VVPVVPQPVARKPLTLEVRELGGTVEVRHAGAEWGTAQVGQLLEASDSIRTQNGSYAVLIGGSAYEVRMEPGTEISVAQISDSISALLLESGMASAKVNGDAHHTFEVRAKGSDALARTQEGAFIISNNGAGTVAVGTKEGEVEFLGSGKTVIVRAGQQSIVTPGKAPTDPTPIPASLLLSVKLPQNARIRTKKVLITGKVEPGSLAQVGEQTLLPDAEGTFSTEVALKEGANQLDIRAKSVGGLSAESAH